MQKIENSIKGLDGIDKDSLSVLFNSSRVKVDFDETLVSIDDINGVISKVGYEVLKAKLNNLLRVKFIDKSL